tara:strand:+ start:845 stop:2167 length:1323 start_codon:yes stop_codon:yes gene_type:complete
MAEKETKTVETKVEQVDVNLDDIFNAAPGGESITLPEETEKKPNLFSRKPNVDTSFLYNEKKTENKEESKEEIKEEVEAELKETTEEKVEEPKKQQPKETSKDEIDVDKVLGLVEGDNEEVSEEETPKRGRKKIEGISDVFSKLIKDEKIIPFDDEKELDEYTAKDWEELIQANLEEQANTVRRETPKQFFNSLPEELQIAARYVADGGKDLKGLFGALSKTEEVKELDIKSEGDQERIIREYLGATGYGNAEEIAEEIEIWKDLGKLEAQASKFKPKLDKMQEKVVAKRLQEQEMKKKQQQQASENYMNNVYETLKGGQVGDTKIDRKTQSLLYNGLVNPAYPSISGKNTNLLGHLLEKYQFVEPNYPIIAEALWLLADPKGYKAKIMEKGETKAVEKTVRKLKTAQSQKGNSAAAVKEESKGRATKKLPRNKNIFKRF